MAVPTPGAAVICANCRAEQGAGPFGRRDCCSACGADLHACVQCEFYAPGHYNDCREPQAERVLDKAAANFCDYFKPATAAGGKQPADPKAAARARLDALFSKKS